MDNNDKIDFHFMYLKIYNFVKRIFWRVSLIFIMIYANDEAWDLGKKYNYILVKDGVNQTSNMVSGYNEGAIGFSLIFSICIVMFTWVEINNRKNKTY